MSTPRLPLLGLAGLAGACLWLAWPAPAEGPARERVARSLPSARSVPASATTHRAPAVVARAQAAPRPLDPPARRDTPRPAALSGVVGSAPTGAAALGTLEELTAKQLAKAEKQLAKQEAALEKRADKLDALEDKHDAAGGLLLDAQAAELSASLDVLAAEQALAEALSLPQDTAEQRKARKAAVKAAKKELKAAKKAQKKAAKQIAKAGKQLAKLAGKIAKVAGKVAHIEAQITALEDAIESLAGDFDFQSLRTVLMEGELQSDLGAPLPFAQVTVVDKLTPPAKQKQLLEDRVTPAVYWQGFSQADGSFAAELRLPGHVSEVDVIVTRPGWQGAYSEESLRELWGPFAPAARLSFDDAGLGAILIQLHEVSP